MGSDRELISDVLAGMEGVGLIDAETRARLEASVVPILEQLQGGQQTFAEWVNEDFRAVALNLDVGGPPAAPEVLIEAAGRYGDCDPDGRPMSTAYEVGRGGIGRVLAVEDRHLGRVVAMKVLAPGHGTLGGASTASHMARERFLREARITAQLDHPGILPVHELGLRAPADGEDQLYYTMKLLRGRTLADALRRCVDLESRLKLLPHFENLCQAMAYAHSKGVIHRDIKPDNIMVGEFGTTVVLDWGLASQRGHVEEAGVMGTPAYMSPEQAAGVGGVDERSDVWSLGVVLYQILTGQQPVEGGDARSLVDAVAAARVIPVEVACPEAPAELRAVVSKAMSPRREDRYPSARELADQIEAFRAGRPVDAYDYSSLELARGLLRRRRREVVVGATVGAVALALLGLQGWRSYNRVLTERDLAVAARQEAREQALVARSNLADAYAQKAVSAADEGEHAVARVYAAAALDLDERPDARGIAIAMGRAWHPRLMAQYTPPAPCRHLGWSPEGSLACASDPVVHLWTDGAEDRALGGHDGAVNALDFSADGRWLATGGSDGVIVVTDRSGVAVPLLLEGHTQAVWGLDFSPDGARLLSASRDHSVRVWDRATGALLETYTDHDDWVWDAAFSPDGARIATVSSDGDVRVRGRGNQRFSVARLGGFAVAFSPDGQRVAAGYGDRTARIWSLDGGAPLTLHGHGGGVWDVAFSPDGEILATASADRTVRFWRTADGAPVAVLRGHSDRVRALSYSPDGDRLATAGEDGVVRVWRLRAPAEPSTLALNEEELLDSAFSPSGDRVAAAGADGVVRVHRVSDGEQLALVTAADRSFRSLAWSPDGALLVTGGDAGPVHLWSAEDYEPIETILAHTGPVHDLAFSPDGALMVSASEDHQAVLWEVETRERRCVLKGHDGGVNAAAFSPDGALVLTGGSDRTLRVWDAETCASKETWKNLPGRVEAAAFGLDGDTLVSGGRDGAVRFWSLSRPDEAVATLAGHLNGVFSVVFSPDGATLATGSWDGQIRLWDVADRVSVAVIPAHLEGVTTLAFSPDGALLVSGGWLGRLRFWEMGLLRSPGNTLLARAQRMYGLTLDGARITPDPTWEARH